MSAFRPIRQRRRSGARSEAEVAQDFEPAVRAALHQPPRHGGASRPHRNVVEDRLVDRRFQRARGIERRNAVPVGVADRREARRPAPARVEFVRAVSPVVHAFHRRSDGERNRVGTGERGRRRSRRHDRTRPSLSRDRRACGPLRSPPARRRGVPGAPRRRASRWRMRTTSRSASRSCRREGRREPP